MAERYVAKKFENGKYGFVDENGKVVIEPKFDEAYEKCYFDKIVTTNLTYQLPELKERPYYVEADMSKLIASIVDFMNHDSSMSNVYTSTEKIHQILDAYNRREDLSQHHL